MKESDNDKDKKWIWADKPTYLKDRKTSSGVRFSGEYVKKESKNEQ